MSRNPEIINTAAMLMPIRLRKAREHAGWTQDELATKCQLKPSAISHFETGTRAPSIKNLALLVYWLNVSADYLLGRSNIGP